MKSITSFILTMCIALVSFGQNLPQSIGETLIPSESKLRYTSDGSLTTASILTQKKSETLQLKYEGERGSGDCASYHKMKIAGIVLTAVGGGLVITGGIIIGAAHNSYYNGNADYANYVAMDNGGHAVALLGGLSLGAGIPLLIIGCVKEHKYCRGGRATLDLHSGANGTGLALNF
jgi:hypothetical protein